MKLAEIIRQRVDGRKEQLDRNEIPADFFEDPELKFDSFNEVGEIKLGFS